MWVCSVCPTLLTQPSNMTPCSIFPPFIFFSISPIYLLILEREKNIDWLCPGCMLETSRNHPCRVFYFWACFFTGWQRSQHCRGPEAAGRQQLLPPSPPGQEHLLPPAVPWTQHGTLPRLFWFRPGEWGPGMPIPKHLVSLWKGILCATTHTRSAGMETKCSQPI